MNVDPHSDLVDRFEEAWQQGVPPSLERFLPAAAEPVPRRDALLELVPIDLEYRWRRAAATGGSSWVLEDYVRHFPELGSLDQLAAELIVEEYRVRHRWGDAPAAEVYFRRFAAQSPTLGKRFQAMNARLADERARPQIQAHAIPTRLSPAVPSLVTNGVGALIETIRQYGLLSSAQLEELRRGSLDRFSDAQALGRELLHREWLTPFQVNQLLQGRGHTLILGPYRLLERLGAGGAGQVFKARHQKLNRLVALKVLHSELATDGECVGRFLREIQIVSRLDHPNLIPAYDAGPVEASYFLAMKYIEGTDLGRLVKKGGPLFLAQACDCIRQAALGLQHLHEHGLVHRDIKPHNLMIGRDGVVKVADLGLARGQRSEANELTVARDTGALTPAGAGLMGTTDYLAPEQAIDFHSADIRADIYSLGCSFWYLLIGQPLFPGRSLAETLLSHQTREPPAIEMLRADVPAPIAAILRRMLAKRPEDRYQTPAEVANSLAPYSSSLNPPEPEFELAGWSVRAGAYTTWQMLSTFARRNKAFTALVVLAMLSLAWIAVINRQARQRTEAINAQLRQEQADKDSRTREAVPALVDSAQLSAVNQKLPAAMRQVNLALEYDAGYAPARLLKGQLLIARLDFDKAQAELRRYLESPPSERTEEANTRELLRLSQNVHPEDGERLLAMTDVLQRQKAFGPAACLMQEILKRKGALEKLVPRWQNQIDAAWNGLGKRLTLRNLVTLELDLRYCEKVRDLSSLKGIPLKSLDLYDCRGVQDLAPLQGMPLTNLGLHGCAVQDLSPLQGMPLTTLDLAYCQGVRDLAPLKGLPLTSLSLYDGGEVQDLSPLRGMPLTTLRLGSPRIRDLSPLRGMRLTTLGMRSCSGISDLSPLQGMPLNLLDLSFASSVRDLSPLRGMPLSTLVLTVCPAQDLSPLAEMDLSEIYLPIEVAKGMTGLRQMKGLASISGLPAKEFWQKYDRGDFKNYKP